MIDLKPFLVPPDIPIKQVIEHIDRNAQGIVLVVDEEQRLVGTITDGDIRRAVLAGLDLNLPAQELLKRKVGSPYPTPVTAPAGTHPEQLIALMNKHTLRHIPLLDNDGRVKDIALLTELVKEHELPLTAVIMAGGYGTRLRPLTEKLPKPMLPVNGRPLLEYIVEQLQRAGISRVNVTTHYKKDMIASHFGNGQEFGLQIEYVEEEHPLGTAGALSLVGKTKEPILVINGDILTRVDIRSMLMFHHEHQADMTVGLKEYEYQIPFGAVEIDGIYITGIAEKPIIRHFINAGIYVINPAVLRHLPAGQPCDMPDLIAQLVAKGQRVIGFPITEYWLDVGHHANYQKAQEDIAAGIMS